MDEKSIYQLNRLIKSSMNYLNYMWVGATGEDHAKLCRAYGELVEARKMLEAEIDRLENPPYDVE